MRVLALLGMATLAPGIALAQQSPVTEEQRAALETLRAEVAGQIQLQAYDLLDELVWGWTQAPPFPLDTPVVLAGVSVPVGFGSGMQSLVETHFASVVIANPRSHVQLAHCPACTATVVHSVQKATVIARGVDQPEALDAAGALAGARHAVFLDFEAEGSSLVLRARITDLTPALPIVWAKTLSTSTSTPALLRTGAHLKSAAEARQEYFDAINGLTSYTIPFRLVVRSYAQGDQPVAIPPFVWFQAGFEGSFTQARSWTGGISAGFSYAPQLHEAFMVQGRLARLVSGPAASLTRPDLYLYVAANAIDIRGVDSVAFREEVPTPEEIIALDGSDEPHQAFGSLQIGLETRIKNRIAGGIFVETLPTKTDAPSLGTYFTFLMEFHTAGAEVTFCF